MEPFVDSALRSFFAKRSDLFESESTFVAWISEDENFCWSDGYQSTAQFGCIEYRTQLGHVCRSHPLVLKCSPAKLQFKDFAMLSFVNEMYFYSCIWPLFSSLKWTAMSPFDTSSAKETDRNPTIALFAEYLGAKIEASASDFSGVIILQNLQAAGFSMNKRRSFIDYAHLALMMRKLGEFHAHSFNVRQHKPKMLESIGSALRDPYGILLERYHRTIPTFASRGLLPLKNDPKYAGRLANVANILEAGYEFMMRMNGNRTDDPHSVICHGDFLRSNVLFKYEHGEPVDLRFIDMANVRLAPPVMDLALPLYLHADQKTRDEHWDDLLDEYHGRLSNTFRHVRVPSREDITKQFRNNCFYAYMVASYFLGQLIAQDNNMPDQKALIPEAYKDCNFADIPQNISVTIFDQIGGTLADEALTNILKDMIDRDFI